MPRRSKRPRNPPLGHEADTLGLRSARSCSERATARTLRWRRERRSHALRAIAVRFKRARWSVKLLELLVEELYVTEELFALLPPIRDLPVTRYPQLVAVALALRHSWRPDDLRELTRRLGAAGKRVGANH